MDLKPQNILLPAAKDIKIVDFGLAAINRSSMSLKCKAGNHLYASDEKLAENYYDGRDDMWAIGCIIAELLAGTHQSKR